MRCLQAGLDECFLQGERDRLACREAKKKGHLCHKDDESSCDSQWQVFAVFGCYPDTQAGRVKALICMGA
jgi:hypothetical protein